MHDPYKALYLHIPFCVKRCFYCDFDSSASSQDNPAIDEYIDEMCMEIRRNAKEGELAQIETIYIGGGTPSFIGSSRLTKLLYTISVSVRLENVREFTMEANPESINESLIKDIWALGVNRLSIGVQSFDDAVLKILGRAHSSSDAKSAFACAKQRFENVSIDLMCGIPGQSIASLEDSLNTAVSLGVKHVSMYPLTIEPHTLLNNMVLAGEFPEPDEDEQALHMECAERILTQSGFSRYEVANYAVPGYESIHNIAYWTGVPYLGLGRSATTMTQNDERRGRIRDGIVLDDLSKCQMLAEDIMLGMRLAKGVSEKSIQDASAYLPKLPQTLDELCEDGLAIHEEGRYRPTHKGWLCGNELYGRIYDLAP
ncbi:MAG: radical SAM family heme chaperone HemW [Eggerthellaceae bacterium]|nr:radical SAM family heme chaperone HemW [Eggerthellaceae bacterium]